MLFVPKADPIDAIQLSEDLNQGSGADVVIHPAGTWMVKHSNGAQEFIADDLFQARYSPVEPLKAAPIPGKDGYVPSIPTMPQNRKKHKR